MRQTGTTFALSAVLFVVPGLGVAAVAPALGVPAAATSVQPAVEIVSRRDHDVDAFTQGLQFDDQGRLFESVGRFRRSGLRELDPRSGQVLREVALPDDRFGEGLAIVDDRLYQLTWLSGEAYVWDLETFELLDTLLYEGQGWGLCHDGERLVMSDGSDRLTFRDPATFDVLGSVRVRRDGQPVDDLNELECVDGNVWANIWHSDEIVRIDPEDGAVTTTVDLFGILEPHPAEARRQDVLNGIAFDAAAATYFVTGKRWPEFIEIRITEDERA